MCCFMCADCYSVALCLFYCFSYTFHYHYTHFHHNYKSHFQNLHVNQGKFAKKDLPEIDLDLPEIRICQKFARNQDLKRICQKLAKIGKKQRFWKPPKTPKPPNLKKYPQTPKKPKSRWKTPNLVTLGVGEHIGILQSCKKNIFPDGKTQISRDF